MKKSGIILLTLLTVILIALIGTLMVRILLEAKKEAGSCAPEGVEAVQTAEGEEIPMEGAVPVEGVEGTVPEGAPESQGTEGQDGTPEAEASGGSEGGEAEVAPEGGEAAAEEESSSGGVSFERLISKEDRDRLSGYGEAFSFDGKKNDVWTGFGKTSTGEDIDLVLPVVVDNGENVLADAYRKVICAVFDDFFNNGAITPCTLENGTMNDADKLAYQYFLNVLDLYSSARYYYYDGFDQPVLLLMGAHNDEGAPLEKVSFVGRIGEYRVYEFDNTVPLAENIGIIAHDFTHDLLAEGREGAPEGAYSNMDEEICNIMGTLAMDLLGSSGELPGVSDGEFHALSQRFKDSGMSSFDEFRFFMNLAVTLTNETDYESARGLMGTVLNDIWLSDYASCI